LEGRRQGSPGGDEKALEGERLDAHSMTLTVSYGVLERTDRIWRTVTLKLKRGLVQEWMNLVKRGRGISGRRARGI